MEAKKLYRSRTNKVIAGIGGGMGDYLKVDPTVIRVIMALLGFLSAGAFIIAYIILIFVIPEEPVDSTGKRKKVKNEARNF